MQFKVFTESENCSDSSFHRIFESENFMFPVSAKNSLIWGVKCEKLNFRKSQGNLLDKVRKLQMNGTVIQKILEILSPPEGTENSRQFLLLRTEILTENCSWVPLFAEHFCQKKTVPSYLKFLNERGRETAVSGSSRKRTRSVHEKGVRNWSWLLTTRPILQQNGNVS